MKSRLCIYLTFDKQKIVDAYIGYMLKQLKTCCDCVVVICNEEYVQHGTEYLEKYGDKIFYRENKGFDAGGFKDGLCSLIGWDAIYQYDELVLANDSFYGPFQNMTDIFTDMEACAADFWGLTKHGQSTAADGQPIPEHLQSFFLVIRENMLKSRSFRTYWEEMPYYQSFDQVVKKHEMYFTAYFAQKGFLYDCYADMAANDSLNPQNNFMQYGAISYELIKLRRFPFLKKQQLSYDTLSFQTQENHRRSMDYIHRHTTYDIDLIWQNIIRTLDPSDLYRNLNLHFIVDEEKRYNGLPDAINILIAVFIRYRESLEFIDDYLQPALPLAVVRIYSPLECVLQECGKNGYEVKKYDGSAMETELLLEMSHYKYVCAVHDTDITGNCEWSCIGKSYFYSIWENLLKNENYITGIIEMFSKNKRLGLLVPPAATFGNYFRNLGECWETEYEAVKKEAENLQLSGEISAEKRPFAASENFWVRGELLKGLIARQPKRNGILPFLLCYIARESGYYSGMVESRDYASMDKINLRHYLNQIVDQVRRQYGKVDNFMDMKKHIFEGAAERFCSQYKVFYVYGAGGLAKEYEDCIPDIEAYIVSDGQPKTDRIMGKRVIYLSELPRDKEIGIIVCLNDKNRMQAVALLEQAGFHNYLCI